MKKINMKKVVLVAAAAILLIGTTVFAAYNLLMPDEAAEHLGDSKLAENLKDSRFEAVSKTDGDYTVHLLGVVSGENLSDFEGSAWEIVPERTYAVAAVEKTDKTPMTFEDPIMVTPLIQGLSPWQYNIASMHGSYTEDIIDGILYRIIEMDSIECFYDQKIYMAATDSVFIGNEHFSIDEATGEIKAKEEYTGTNILFELDVDKSKADPEKASRYLIKLKGEWEDGATEGEITEGENEEYEEIILTPDLSTAIEDIVFEKTE